MKNRNLIVYIACSLDGYIAFENDDLSFLERVEREGEDYGYQDFMTRVDTVIVGKRTYDWVQKNAPGVQHPDKELFVITHTERPQEGNAVFYTGDLKTGVQQLKEKPGKTIFCDGGAQVITQLLQEKLVDEIIVSLIPVLLGKGIRLFQDQRPQQDLTLRNTKTFESGLVQLHYRVNS
ncbi:dihydrofolate reductase family protein [Sphingobacterium sp. Mn56C]|uniref:dihydrofolate reductase family protein n=1 Tax=Sphingobacterium sp. Mn56C TaxID=3395261 RepID=UPI003BD256F6